jgi:flagellar hook-basal body complex protein FliE
MADPLGLIGGAGGAGGINPSSFQRPNIKGPGGEAQAPGQSFKDVLIANLDEVNKAQQEATRAVEDLTAGKRNDLEGVIFATQKADNAFRMLQALRNKMVDAYDEIKQIRS